MRQLTVEETKKIAVDILDVVTQFCEERGINYWIDYGTLLGAVRHKGFIPWDDDIDIGMLRPDYDRFMKEFNGYNPRYEFHSIENDPDFVWPFGKVIDNRTVGVREHMKYATYGINIDIFVHDNAPDDDETARKMYRLRHFYVKMSFIRFKGIFAQTGGNVLKRLCTYAFRAMLKIFPRSYFTRKAVENSKRYMFANTRRVGEFVSGYHSLIDKSIVRELVDMEFEGKNYKAPARYDEVLTQYYGDYMTPPPPEKRTRTHNFFTGYLKDPDE